MTYTNHYQPASICYQFSSNAFAHRCEDDKPLIADGHLFVAIDSEAWFWFAVSLARHAQHGMLERHMKTTMIQTYLVGVAVPSAFLYVASLPEALGYKTGELFLDTVRAA